MRVFVERLCRWVVSPLAQATIAAFEIGGE
jgi:hypothetical protein